ncbi:SIR2 family protein [Rhodopirellula sp. JC639]|uniref:SIR2 family protein n=1 Tax=Stieleria mannarensis TaxID=2755585 RepID=UPI00160172FA|nr:SIR2 family protein [Rhodopirellula sp. JC639]
MSSESDQKLTASTNVIKTRDDFGPVLFEKVSCEEGEVEPCFAMVADSTCSWLRPNEKFGVSKLRERIEPWLTSLCQSEHLSLLVGSGLSNAVHRRATGKGLPGMAKANFGAFDPMIQAEARRSAKACGRSEGNIEDQLRSANELLRGFDVYGVSGDKTSISNAASLRASIQTVLESFAKSIYDGERGIASANEPEREAAFNYLVSFLMSFASRSGTRDRLHLFTTNYDRVIEAGADAAGMRLLDRFVGSVSPVFRSSRLDLDIHYNPPGIRGEPRYLEGVARFTKLHGSLDWVDFDRTIRRIGLPFGGSSPNLVSSAFAEVGTDPSQLMIYPNAAKDRETTFYPYTELFRDFAASLCRPNHTLVTFGYGFGDDHLNRVIEDMLTVPSTHLVVVSFDDPLRRILNTYEKLGRHAQVSLLIGDHVGEFGTLVESYLPKPAIDRATFRMAELLKARFGTRAPEANRPETPLVKNVERDPRKIELDLEGL